MRRFISSIPTRSGSTASSPIWRGWRRASTPRQWTLSCCSPPPPAASAMPGAAILSRALFDHAPEGEFSLTDLFDRAAEQGRLHGLRLEGLWMHVGTPNAIALAENAIRAGTA